MQQFLTELYTKNNRVVAFFERDVILCSVCGQHLGISTVKGLSLPLLPFNRSQ